MRDINSMTIAKQERKNKTNKVYTIDEIKNLTLDIFKNNGVEKAYLFGSYARGEADELSDVDFMIKKGKVRTLMDLSGLGNDLEDALGKEVDIIMEETYTEEVDYFEKEKINALLVKARKMFYNEVKKELILIYE